MGKTMHDHQQCRSFFEKLSEYIDHELDPATCEVIEKHLQDCQPCQACLATLKQTVALCREMKSTDSKAIPEEFSKRLRAMIQQTLS
jgi:anti-sigma factor RsiW